MKCAFGGNRPPIRRRDCGPVHLSRVVGRHNGEVEVKPNRAPSRLSTRDAHGCWLPTLASPRAEAGERRTDIARDGVPKQQVGGERGRAALGEAAADGAVFAAAHFVALHVQLAPGQVGLGR